jgi:hypothetical protein
MLGYAEECWGMLRNAGEWGMLRKAGGMLGNEPGKIRGTPRGETQHPGAKKG